MSRTNTERERLIRPRTVAELHVLEMGLEFIVRHPEYLSPIDRIDVQNIAQEILDRLAGRSPVDRDPDAGVDGDSPATPRRSVTRTCSTLVRRTDR